MRLILVGLALLAGCKEGNHASPVTDAATAFFRNIGDPCQADRPGGSDCGLPPQSFCDAARPGGYCASYCNLDADCPTGAVCVGAGDMVVGRCEKSCMGSTDCRSDEGYGCRPAGADASHDFCVALTDGGA